MKYEPPGRAALLNHKASLHITSGALSCAQGFEVCNTTIKRKINRLKKLHVFI